jgi:hypothetical protein
MFSVNGSWQPERADSSILRFVEWKLFKRDDPLAPRMPDVDIHTDVAGLFADVRAKVSWYRFSNEQKAGRPCVGIISPDRTISFLAAPASAELPQELVDANKACIPHTKPLNITAVSFTGLRPPGEIKRMTFICCLLPFASIGHSIVVFEGHVSGFEAALKDADVLVIDSGMLPFLQSNWFEVARGVFRDKGRIRMFDRKTMRLPPVVPSKAASGWSYATEPDGERSYVNSLLTTLAQRDPIPVQLYCDERLPELPGLATSPQEIEWTTALPFDYGALNVEEIIRLIENSPGLKWSPAQAGQASGRVRMELAESGGSARNVWFQLLLMEDSPKGRSLRIERVE